MGTDGDGATFGDQLARKRQQAGLRPSDAARQSGLSRGTWSQYENGKASKLTPDTVLKMADTVYWPPEDALRAAGLDPSEHLLARGGSLTVARQRLADKFSGLSPELLRALETVVDALPRDGEGPHQEEPVRRGLHKIADSAAVEQPGDRSRR